MVLSIQSSFPASRSSIHKVSIQPPRPSGAGYRPELDGLPIRRLDPSPSAPALRTLRAGAPSIISGRLILTLAHVDPHTCPRVMLGVVPCAAAEPSSSCDQSIQIAVPCYSLAVLVAAASMSSMMTSPKRWSPVVIRVVASNGPGEPVGIQRARSSCCPNAPLAQRAWSELKSAASLRAKRRCLLSRSEVAGRRPASARSAPVLVDL